MRILPCLLLSTVVLVWEVAAIAGGPDDDPCRPADWCVLHDTRFVPAMIAKLPSASAVVAACPVAEPKVCVKDSPELLDHAYVKTLEGIRWLFVPVGPSGTLDGCGAKMKLGLSCQENQKKTAHYASWQPRPLDLGQLSSRSLVNVVIVGAPGISVHVE